MAAVNPDSNYLLDAALTYAQAGIQVFPCNKDKEPLSEHGMLDATTDPAQIRGWWRRWPDALIAGRIPEHLIVLDIDPRHSGDSSWNALAEDYAPAVTHRWHLSGRGDGGRHLWFQRPEGKLTVKGLNDWAKKNGHGEAAGKLRWTAGIDILHHGHRYSILPPSPHPDTGQPYTWGEEGEADELPLHLQYLLTTEPEQPARPGRPQLRIADENSVADWFSGNTSWHDLLTPAGWHLVGGDGDTDGSKWRHPNATAKHSATIRHGCLFVYTGNTDFEETESGDPHGYTRFRAWAILEHANDLSVAAYAAMERRDGPTEEPDHSFIGDITGTPPPVAEESTESAKGEWAKATEQPWPELIPLVDVVELPTFPLHLLPDWLAEHVQQVAEDLQVAIDLPAILGLGALSVAALGRATVRYPRQRWTQPLNLYTAVALPPSAGKSPAKNAMFAALEDYELERIAAAKADSLRAQSEVRILKKRLDDLEASAARNGDKNAAREAAELALELITAESSPTGRLMADDATTESLGDVLANAGGSIAVVSAEGGLFDKLAGMYSDKATNMDLFLEGWSGGRYVVDRIKRASISIPHANVTVVTTVQPHTLDAIGARKEFAGRGLTARFLLALPPSNVGHRDRRRQVVGDDYAEERYGCEIVELAKRLARVPAQLDVVNAAADLFAEWDQELEDDLAPGRELAHLPEWVGKLRANMLRVAALLHLAHGCEGHEIGETTVAAVIELGEYFVAHARHIADRWGMSGEVSQATEIIEWIRRERLDEFSVRDLHRNHQRLFQKADDMGPPLELLTERGWLRPMFDGDLSFGRGRGASPRFAVNPQVREVR